MFVTEVGCMGIKPGLDIMNESTSEGEVLIKAWKAVITAPGGPHRVYWGVEIDDPSKIWAFFDWESIEAHESFAKSFGGEAVKDLPSILTHGEFTKHVAAAPSLRAVLQSPVAEIILAYFPSDISSAMKDSAAAQLQQFIDKGLGNSSDVKNMSYGSGVENDFPVRGGAEGQVGSVIAAFFAWTNIGATVKFRETETFKEIMRLIRGMEGIVNVAVIRISCRSLERKPE